MGEETPLGAIDDRLAMEVELILSVSVGSADVSVKACARRAIGAGDGWWKVVATF
jgi:hypothetical protein